MATIRKTIYRCDICAETVEKKGDLWRQRIIPGTVSFADLHYHSGQRPGILIEMCETCEKTFVANVMEFTDSETAADLLRPRLRKEYDIARKEMLDGEAEKTGT